MVSAPDAKTANIRPPRLYLTADDDEFDGTILQHFREEGFDVSYLPMGDSVKAYKDSLRHLADDLELGENYAVIGKASFYRPTRHTSSAMDSNGT